MPFFVTRQLKVKDHYDHHQAAFGGYWIVGGDVLFFKELHLWKKNTKEGFVVSPPFKLKQFNPWRFYMNFQKSFQDKVVTPAVLEVFQERQTLAKNRELARKARKGTGQGFEVEIQKLTVKNIPGRLAILSVALKAEGATAILHHLVLAGSKTKPKLSVKRDDPAKGFFYRTFQFNPTLLKRVEALAIEAYQGKELAVR